MLEYLGIPFSVIVIPTESQGQVKVSWAHLSQHDFATSIFFMSAGTCLRLSEIHPKLFQTPRVKLGYFLWELPDFPNKLRKALDLVDHIWCPTKFVQGAFFNKAKKLTLSIPLPVIKHKPSKDDIIMFDWIVSMGYSPIVIATKFDKLKVKERQPAIDLINATLDTNVIPFSAETGFGREEIWQEIRLLLKEYKAWNS